MREYIKKKEKGCYIHYMKACVPWVDAWVPHRYLLLKGHIKKTHLPMEHIRQNKRILMLVLNVRRLIRKESLVSLV